MGFPFGENSAGQKSQEGGICEGDVAQTYRKLRAKFAQGFVPYIRGRVRKIVLQICREFESQCRTILCKYPFSNAPFSKFLISELVLQVRTVASGVDTEFLYWVRIVDRGVDCRDPVCRHCFRFPDASFS